MGKFSLESITQKEFWDKGVPIRSAFVEAGLQTSATRWSNRLDFENSLSNFKVRDEYIKNFGFAVPCREVLERISILSKHIVEVGSGSGFIASQLSRFGVDVKSTDLNTISDYKFTIGKHYPVEKLGANHAVLKYSDRDVLSSWPNYNEPWLYEAIQHMKEGRLLFYIGEGSYGCTADDNFHTLVNNEKEFEFVDEVSMVQFYGINDNLTIYKRRKKNRVYLP